MKCNVGMIDRALRAVVGIALVIWAIVSGNMIGYVGIVLIGTALLSFCPFYPLLGINTSCKLKEKE